MTKITAGTPEYNEIKKEILRDYQVVSTKVFDAKQAIEKRVTYLKNFLRDSGRKSYVLGISGGVDSTTTGRLAQMACEQLRSEGYSANFIAVRLPAGVQKDEADAQSAIKFINADKTITINIGEAATNFSMQSVNQYEDIEGTVLTPSEIDYNKGNIKARLRMVAQYQLSAMYQGLVLGTDHPCEKVMAFYTRFGDECCDLTVLDGVNKRQIRLMAKEMGAPEFLWSKAPTADLEELVPGKLDDEGFGFSYHYLEDFLEGMEIALDVEEKIVNHFNNTRFKRSAVPSYPS